MHPTRAQLPSIRILRSARARSAVVGFACAALTQWPVAGEDNLPVVAVGEVEASSRLLPATTMRAAIEAALMEMPAFATMKHKDFSAILGERGMPVGLAKGDPALRAASGIDYVLSGRVRASVASKLSPLGSLLRVLRSGAECTAAVGLRVDVVDLGSGDVVFNEHLTHRVAAEVVYPPGADYSDPCSYSNRSRKWRALQAASEHVATEAAAMLTLALFPIRLVRIAETEVTLDYGEAFLSVGDQLKVFAMDGGDRNRVETAEPIHGYLAVTAVSAHRATAEITYARRAFTTRDRAAVLSKDERRELKRVLATAARVAARRERACDDARKRVRRYCGRAPDARRCRDAEAAVEANCDG